MLNTIQLQKISYNLAYITAICKDQHNQIWLGTSGDGLFLARADTDSGEVSVKIINCYKSDGQDSLKIAGNWINAITEDIYGNIWIGTASGLSCLHKKAAGKYNITNYKHESTNENSLSSDLIRHITIDDKSNLVIGTFGGGINYLNTHDGTFRHFKNNRNDITSLSSDLITSVHIDKIKKNIVWAGTRSAGFNRLDLSSGKCTRYQNENASATEIGIVAIYQDRQGTIWLGTWGNGISS